MEPLTRSAIQRGLVNVTKSERAALTTPADFEATDWAALDFFGWRDPKFPHRGYLVRQRDQALLAVAVATTGGGRPGRKAMCDICRAVDNSDAVALFTARRVGAAGRNGNTVGTYLCAGLDCSAQLRRPRNRIGRTRPDGGRDVEVVAAEMVRRLDSFLDTVRAE